MRNELRDAIDGVLDSGQFILGENVKALEEEVAEFCDAKYGIGVASGSDALTLSLLALDIRPGDEVITSPFTFIATAGAIALLGAKVVFADIDPSTFNIDPEKIKPLITKRTKAILPIHLYGQPADMDPIIELAEEYGLKVLEDAAQARGRVQGAKGMQHWGCCCIKFLPHEKPWSFRRRWHGSD